MPGASLRGEIERCRREVLPYCQGETAVVREVDLGVTRTLMMRLNEPGTPAQDGNDLEIEVPRFVHEVLRLDRDHRWQFSIHRGSIHLLPP